ncbi:MAG: insulinase family protein [Parachlamydiaceae bacterium]|nr:insulinase family protein [Parachlamydiaceae bacterium]
MTKKPYKFQTVGQRYHDFEVTKSLEIAELQCHFLELVHLPTGAQVMHLANEDPENLFCLSFQTFPDSSNGVAHILEHTVLCGSKKFPVKDPFFAMGRRSLNTFMNALTGADFTCYPAATQVTKDFYNLLEVYLDAVFHPNLNLLSFLQEGHRIEFAIADDPTSSLEYKGVVFNEMKGAMASANSRLNETINAALFPDLTYGVNSGGDPEEIPKLTFEALREFHREAYHPSRCLFFFYGNLPLDEHLDFIEKHTLSTSKKLSSIPPLPRQKRFSKRKHIQASYPMDANGGLEGKTYIAFAWLTCHVLEQEELLALSLLESVLLDTDASPLKRALLKSGLCKQVSSYIDTDLSEAPFIITLRGCDPDNTKPLEELIAITLAQIAEIGIPLEKIESSLHQLEFHRSEVTGDHGPYGLSLFMRSALLKQHGANPEEGLEIHSLVETLRKHLLSNPDYFSHLIRKHLLDNPHSVVVTSVPDPTLAGKEAAAEQASLKKIRESLTAEQVQALIKQAAELATFQAMQEEESEEILPKIMLEDVPKIARDFTLNREKVGNLEVFHHPTFTNEILYCDLVYDVPKTSEEDLPLLRLFTVLLSQMGCGGRNYSENLEFVQAYTGGIGASLTFNLQANNTSEFKPSLYIRGKALHRKAEKLLNLIHDMATTPDFTDLERLREVMVKHFTTLQSSLHQGALRYAINLSACGLDYPSRIANSWYGLEYYWKIKSIVEEIDTMLPWLSEKLSIFSKTILGLENPHLVMTCNAAHYDELKRHEFYGLASIDMKPFEPWDCSEYSLPTELPQGRIIPSPIAFISKVFKVVPYMHPHAPALNIAAFLCDNLVLHAKIREQGGAYGGGSICNSMASNFYFYSYRDPNIRSTLEAFDEGIAELVAGNFDDADLEEAKLEMIQTLDAPVPPGTRGDFAYGWLREGKPQHVRQKFRTAILELSKNDVIEAVKAEILSEKAKGIEVVFANKELLDKENALRQVKGLPLLLLKKI